MTDDALQLDTELEMHVRAQRAYALHAAVGRYMMDGLEFPRWLACAILSPWGRAAFANAQKQAEEVLDPQRPPRG